MTREEIIRMARETGVEWLMHNQFYKDHLQHFAALVAEAEREAILQMSRDQWFRTQADFDDAIRARGRA